MKKAWAIFPILLTSSSLFAGSFYAGVSGGYQTLTNTMGGIANEFIVANDVNSYLYNSCYAHKLVV
ncbi:hypothetical protein [Legionella sp. km772]|uniref:hypothetical protein n=1 Tax=Legionella sp. km772 TaxID=2498111 RepID=UPI000F8D622D|nr:hypothetical protein [Legionella sp. km772]RUR05646.1 hypothetical protein ELY15_14060 [Legionella sp. km772]